MMNKISGYVCGLAMAAVLSSGQRRLAADAVDPVIAQIRDEEQKNSQLPFTLNYLCNVIGARLTGSPAQVRASEWTRDTLASWGLSNAHLEPWGPFGRGWVMNRFSMQVTSPNTVVLRAYPKAWSPGVDGPIDMHAVYLQARNTDDLQKYQGKLKGKAVLIGLPRKLDAHFDAEGTRLTADQLAKLASAPAGRARTELLQTGAVPTTASGAKGPTTDASATTRPSPAARNAAALFAAEELAFAAKEGAAIVLDNSFAGDGGNVFVASASVPVQRDKNGHRPDPASRPRVYGDNLPAIPPQFTLASEDYDRLLQLLADHQDVTLSVDLRVTFIPSAQVNPADTVAELPGSDLADQIVMVGGHLDSWHAGEGATDNGVGAATAMEAIRILKALDLHPRRTIRVGLWTGEEEGLLGSSAYVKKHFGYFPDEPAATQPARQPATQPVERPLSEVIKLPEYEKLSIYLNLDNGTGKIRGIYAQGNTAAADVFKKWLSPFGDLDATTITLSNTGATDHIPFDRIGLPGFQFIQDPIEYNTRTHHSSADTFERIQMDDLKQAATIMAALLWDAANTHDRFPRKPATRPAGTP